MELTQQFLEHQYHHFTKINHTLFNRCIICNKTSPCSICWLCFCLLPWAEHYCQKCLTALPRTGLCGQCQTKVSKFQMGVIAFYYQSPIAEILHKLKYQNGLEYASAIAHSLAVSLFTQFDSTTKPEIIIPIPLHQNRLKQRGYNQVAEIVKYLSPIIEIPICWDALERIKDTHAQVGLSEAKRRKNISNAFAIKNPLETKSVLLVDDVITSGSTMVSAAQCLKSANIDNIIVAAIAKT